MFFKKKHEAKKLRLAEAAEAKRKADEEKKQTEMVRELEVLLDRAEEGDVEAQEELVRCEWRSSHPIRKRRIAANAHMVAVRREYGYAGNLCIRAHARWLKFQGTTQEIDTLADFLNCYRRINIPENLSRMTRELGIKRKYVVRRLSLLVRTRYEELLSQSDDIRKFEELWDFIRRTRSNSFHDSRGKYRYSLALMHAGKPMPYPDSWNDLVARHYDTPSITMFIRQPERGPGDARLLAAEAIRTNSFTQAQIALAYCNNDAKFRAAAGDVLTAELAKLVMRHRAEMEVPAEKVAE